MLRLYLLPALLLLMVVVVSGRPIGKARDTINSHIDGYQTLVNFIETVRKEHIANNSEYAKKLFLPSAPPGSFQKQVFNHDYWVETNGKLLKNTIVTMLVESFVANNHDEMETMVTKTGDLRVKIMENDKHPYAGRVEMDKDVAIALEEISHSISQIETKLTELKMKSLDLAKLDAAFNQVKLAYNATSQAVDRGLLTSEEVKDTIDCIKDTVDKVRDVVDRIKDFIERILDFVHDWYKDIPDEILEEIFWALYWIMQNVEIPGDGTIIIGDEVYNIADIIMACCIMG